MKRPGYRLSFPTCRTLMFMAVASAITTLSGDKLEPVTAGGVDIRFLPARSPSLNVESDYAAPSRAFISAASAVPTSPS